MCTSARSSTGKQHSSPWNARNKSVPEEHCFCTPIDQSPSRATEDTPLAICDATDHCHSAVVRLHIFKFVVFGHKHCRRGNRTIETCFHDHPSANDPNRLVGTLSYGRTHHW